MVGRDVGLPGFTDPNQALQDGALCRGDSSGLIGQNEHVHALVLPQADWFKGPEDPSLENCWNDGRHFLPPFRMHNGAILRRYCNRPGTAKSRWAQPIRQSRAFRAPMQ